MEELISVIIPVYNVEEYLSACLESVTGQTYKNLEIIVIDDGSTDKSGIICDEYCSRDNRIKVIHKKNGGLSDARNSGLKAAKGQYIGFVDSDDWIAPEMYEVLYRSCKAHGADISFARYKDVAMDASQDDVIDDSHESKKDSWQAVTSEQYLESILTGKGEIASNWSVCVRLYKADVMKVLRFEKGKCFEDVLYSTKVIMNTSKCIYVNRNLYYYRCRTTSITNTSVRSKFDRKIVTDLMDQENKAIDYLDKSGEKRLFHIAKAVFYQQMLFYDTKNPYREYERKFKEFLIKCKLSLKEIYGLPSSNKEKIKIIIKMYMPVLMKCYYKVSFDRRTF